MTISDKDKTILPPPAYMSLVRHYEACLQQHGPTHRGVDWPNEEDLKTRFDVMLGLIRPQDLSADRPVTLLDLGCGPGLLLSHIASLPISQQVIYEGIDLSPAMIAAAQALHGDALFSVRDLIADPLPAQSVDYTILNGVLTERRDLSFEAMEDFAVQILQAGFQASRRGIAFNVMSSHVDWEREDLFHWPLDRMMTALTPMSRHIVIRADYGLYEYAVYVHRDAQTGSSHGPAYG